jgi:ribonuclease R
VIAAVTSFGLFVELEDLYIEGLVHVTALPADYYHFDKARQRLNGERSGRSFQIGGIVRVQVARVDLDDRKIDLELIEAKPALNANAKKPQKKTSGKDARSGKKAAPDKKSTPSGKSKGKTGLRRRR